MSRITNIKLANGFTISCENDDPVDELDESPAPAETSDVNTTAIDEETTDVDVESEIEEDNEETTTDVNVEEEESADEEEKAIESFFRNWNL